MLLFRYQQGAQQRRLLGRRQHPLWSRHKHRRPRQPHQHRPPRRRQPHLHQRPRPRHPGGNPDRGGGETHTVADPRYRRQRLPSSRDRMPREFPVEPPVWGNDSDQVQVGSPGLRKDLFGVPLVFSPDVHSEFGSTTKTAPRYGSIQSVEIALPHPNGRHGPVHGTSESKYGCVARGQLTVVFNLEVEDRQFLLPGPCLWRHTNPLPSRFMGPEPGSRIPVMTAHQRGNINRCPTGPADNPERGRQPQVRRRERRSARPVSGEAAVSGLLNSMGRGEYIQP